MTIAPTPWEHSAFYRAALIGLRALDARETAARRFGADADARWGQFAGALGAGDRIDILLRDAAGTWGAAFSPAACFGAIAFGLADDEPFGPDWAGLDDKTARRLLAESTDTLTLDGVASALGVKPSPVSVPPLTPSTKLVVAGGGAIVAVAKAFANNPALSWADQVAVVADRALFRQLAGLASVLVGSRRAALLRSVADSDPGLRSAGFAHLDEAVVSPDAEPDAAELALKLGAK